MSGASLEGPIYIDSSALIKRYLPEPGSDEVEQLIVGRTDLLISELVITEIVSALSRRRREEAILATDAGSVYSALLEDSEAGYFGRIPLSPDTHRTAERLLLLSSIPLRSLDALHLALGMAGQSRTIITFDSRLFEAATIAGLRAHTPRPRPPGSEFCPPIRPHGSGL